MPDPQAQRTLVKSPPELWAEISDVGTLARHLGEFGEIRITRTEAETTVVWEGDRARGTVELEPSGWGTKVTITAEAADGGAVPEATAVVIEPAPEPAGAPEPPAEDITAPVEDRWRGFWARLLARRRPAEPAVAPEPEARTLQAILPDPEPQVEPERVTAEPLDDDHVEAVLVSVLDDLGRAHHRPFSRG